MLGWDMGSKCISALSLPILLWRMLFVDVWFSVCLSIHPSIRLQFTSTLAFKSIQMTYSLKPLHPCVSNFMYSMIRLQDIRIVKFSLFENSRLPQILKIAKLIKSLFSPERLDILGWNCVWSISRTLMMNLTKMKKICCRIGSQWPFKNLCWP